MLGEHSHHTGLGPEGYCICPQCGYKKLHTPGIPCREEKCPNCGAVLIREGSKHERLIEGRKNKLKI